jgi:xylose dehydrogenase (NAD/NADP)
MNKIRWGLLCTANINRRVIPAIREAYRSELVGVASRKKRKARAYARRWEIPKVFGSYQEMLDSGEIEAVYISLPNHLHAEWSIKAMEAGMHVLCEKPFAISLEEVDAMIATKNKTGRVLAEAFMYRHHPQTQIAGEMVHSGKLGEIALVRGTFDFAFDNRENVRLVPEWGGGCLWDVGVYPLSFAQFIMGGPPAWVLGSQWLGENGVDETFAGQMGYPGERFAQIGAAFRTPFYTFVEVIGTAGRLHISMPFVSPNDGVMTFYPKDGEPEVIPVPDEYLYLGEIKDMEAAILDDAPNYLSLAETRNHIKTVLALYESARRGEVVKLKE